MTWFLISQLFPLMLTSFRLARTSETDKDLGILIRPEQLGILQRQQDKPVKPTRTEKLTLAVLATSLSKQTNRFINRCKCFICVF